MTRTTLFSVQKCGPVLVQIVLCLTTWCLTTWFFTAWSLSFWLPLRPRAWDQLRLKTRTFEVLHLSALENPMGRLSRPCFIPKHMCRCVCSLFFLGTPLVAWVLNKGTMLFGGTPILRPTRFSRFFAQQLRFWVSFARISARLVAFSGHPGAEQGRTLGGVHRRGSEV